MKIQDFAFRHCHPELARRMVGYFMVVKTQRHEPTVERIYQVVGQVFFASADQFSKAFDFKEAINRVIIDVSGAHFWDITAVSALDKAVIKFRREGTRVDIIGMNEATATIVDRFALHNKPEVPEVVDKILSDH